MSDNAAVVVFLRKKGDALSKVLCDLAQEEILLIEALLVALTAKYIPREKNIVVDQLSLPDQVVSTELSFLSPSLMQFARSSVVLISICSL